MGDAIAALPTGPRGSSRQSLFGRFLFLCITKHGGIITSPIDAETFGIRAF